MEDLIFLTLLRLEVPWMSPVILIDDTCSGEAEEEEEDGQAGTTKPPAALDDDERDDASGTQLAEGKEKESPSPWKSLAIEDNRTDRTTLAEKHTLASGRPVYLGPPPPSLSMEPLLRPSPRQSRRRRRRRRLCHSPY